MEEELSLSKIAELLGKSKETLRRWDREGKLSAVCEPMSNYRGYRKSEIQSLFDEFLQVDIDEENPKFLENPRMIIKF